ncbi:hypothetical protein ACWD7C_38335 [Streptomyces sp. NPDC005134]|uniref:hypothetical protein n=1 Tax=Streptomyces sp. NPDC005098 TaxID=3154560 RepID=UPI0033A76EE3
MLGTVTGGHGDPTPASSDLTKKPPLFPPNNINPPPEPAEPPTELETQMVQCGAGLIPFSKIPKLLNITVKAGGKTIEKTLRVIGLSASNVPLVEDAEKGDPDQTQALWHTGELIDVFLPIPYFTCNHMIAMFEEQATFPDNPPCSDLTAPGTPVLPPDAERKKLDNAYAPPACPKSGGK